MDAFEVYREIVDQELGAGEEKARHLRHLISILEQHGPIKQGFLTTRWGYSGASVREMVRTLRRMGSPVHSGRDGYEINADKIDDTIKHLEARANSIKETVAALRQVELDIKAQRDLF